MHEQTSFAPFILGTNPMLQVSLDSQKDEVPYPVPIDYCTAAGSHVWDCGCVHVESAHTEVSSLLASSYRSLRLFGFNLMTVFFSLMHLLPLLPHLLS